MSIVNSFLTSGYEFSKDENLQRFRFSLLNSSMLIASIFTFINYFSSVFKFVPFPPLYEKIVLFYAFACLFSIAILRVKKSYFLIATNIVVLSSLIVFYAALFMVVADEFRLIWFFLVVFASFVLAGKRYGMVLMSFVLISILIINQVHDLGFSRLAQFSFFNSFLIFAAFSFFFLQKIEKDALEFKSLNNQLTKKVIQETHQREEQEQMLLRQYRMVNMGEMLDSIAHQWRQPLMHINSVLMNMSVALDDKKTDEKYLEKKIDEVSSLTSHMSQTIEDFRDLFKQEKELTEFSLENAINDVLSLMKNSFDDIKMDINVAAEIRLTGYRSEFIQVLIILLSNAVEALDYNQTVDKKIKLKVSSNNETITIIIEDNAGGISPKILDTIFDPYFTTKKQSGGTGLGLYIVKIIVEHNMKGVIIASNIHNGARFTLSLARSL